MSNYKAIIEALLFVNQKPIMIEQLRRVFTDLEPAQIRSLVEELKTEYLTPNRGMRIIEVAGGFKMFTDSDLNSFLKKFYQKPLERLSQPTMETLAIIAYKQPITRLEIEKIRGVDASSITKSLSRKGFLRTVGRKKVPGRPFLYGTTRQFLEYFGLRSLEDLPKMEDFLKAEGDKDELKTVTSKDRPA